MKTNANSGMVIVSVLVLLALCGPAWATDYYVDKDNGSDDSNGLSLPEAFATIAKATSTFTGGDTIYIAEASTPYYEPINLAGKNCGGTAGQYTKICGLPGQRPIISGLGHTDHQGKIILLKDKVYIELCDLEVESDDFGIGMGHYGGGADNCKFHNNIFRSITGNDNSSTAIQLHDGSYNNEVYNNIFYNLRTAVLLARSSSVSGNRIVNNLFYNCGKGVAFYEGVKPANNLVANNIVTNCEVGFYGNGPVEEGPLFNNCVFNNITDFQGVNLQPINSVTADPMYVNLGTYDFHLTAASPCIDGGIDTGITDDFEGNPRPQGLTYDIGPYETDITLTLVELEIIGPAEVPEDSEAQYRAFAQYDNNSTRDVTGSAAWSMEPDTYASIGSDGLLVTEDIEKYQDVTISAQYTESGITVNAEKKITIFAICPTGTALQFDGQNDYVDVPMSVIIPNAAEKSIALWFKVSSWTKWARLFMWYDGTNRVVMCLGEHEGKIGGTLNNNVDGFHTGSMFSIGEWHHACYTFDGSTTTVYFDGKQVSELFWDEWYVNDQGVFIGARKGNCCQYFNGAIDDVRVYDRGLSSEEIQANMHTRLTGDEAGLVGYWDFDEGEGQIVYDLSGNGNDGQLGSTGDIDSSDPAWVESDAPIGICSPYLIATLATERAVARKTALLEELLAALAQEWAAYEALEELLESGDYGDLNKGDIVTAKQKIHSATRNEEQAIDALEKSIEKLKDALSALGYEPEER